MADIIDISMPLWPGMVAWPGSPAMTIKPALRLKAGDIANVSRFECDVHSGTHVDSSWHFLENGTTVEQLPLEVLVGPAFVADLREVSAVTASDLASLQLPTDMRRLLLRTKNSERWSAESNEFDEDYVALTADAARWVVDHGILLIGIDSLSVQRFHDDPLTHKILLEADVVVLEGLSLSKVPSGTYELICLPVPLVGVDGAPARAILRPLLHYERHSKKKETPT